MNDQVNQEQQVAFWDAVAEDSDMTNEQKIYWLLSCCRDQHEKVRKAHSYIRSLRSVIEKAADAVHAGEDTQAWDVLSKAYQHVTYVVNGFERTA